MQVFFHQKCTKFGWSSTQTPEGERKGGAERAVDRDALEEE